MKKPFKCPVCEGRGKVPNGFYNSVGINNWSTNSTDPDTCKSCNGNGIIWGEQDYEYEIDLDNADEFKFY